MSKVGNIYRLWPGTMSLDSGAKVPYRGAPVDR